MSGRRKSAGTLALACAVAGALLAASGCSNSDPVAAVARARREVAAGERRQAIFELREFVRRHPASPGVRVLLARLELDQGDVPGARIALEGLDPHFADEPDAVLEQVQLAAAAGHPQEALDQLDSHGAALDPAVLAVEKARLLSALARRPEALAALEEARDAHPDSLPVVTEFALETAAAGDLEAARRLLAKSSAVQSDADALAALGTLDVRLSQTALARREFEQALALPAPDWPPTHRWTVELALADVDLAQHDLAATQAILAQLQRELPTATGVRILAARLAMADGRPRDVLRLLAPLVNDDEVDPRVPLLYVSALVETEQPEQARLVVGALQTRIAARPSAEGWRILAAAQAGVHDLPAASASMDEAYRLAPSSRGATEAFRARSLANLPDPEQSLIDWLGRTPTDAAAHSLLGSYYQSRGLLADASHEFEAAVKYDPREVAANNNLAMLLTATDPDRAEKLARAAQALAPQNPAVDDTLGWILVRRKDVPEGLPLLAAAARRMPADPAVQYHYAVGLARAGREREARLILETILLSRRDFEDRTEATRLLDVLTSTLRRTQDG
jgi:predicted Zn-dependent protease